MKFNTAQQHVLEILAEGKSALAIGGPGTGKTTLLMEYAAQQAAASPSNKIGIICFAYRTAKVTEAQFAKKYSEYLAAKQVRIATAKTFAQAALENNPEFIETNGPIHFASNNKVRSLLRLAMEKVEFGGSVSEAEHIIRNFRGQLKKPTPETRHYPLFEAYQNLMEQATWMDRHTIIRKHVVAMDKNTVPPCDLTHILVDHLQDATPIQLRWLLTHQAAGAQILAVGDDDQTLYATDGAIGHHGLQKFAKTKGVKAVTLSEGYRIPQQTAGAVHKVARLLLERHNKAAKEQNGAQAQFVAETFTDTASEWQFIAQHIQTGLKSGQTLGVITRTHEQASRISHMCRLAGLEHASYARPVWEQYGAQLALSTLYVLLGHGQVSQLMTVLNAAGITPILQATLVQSPQLSQGVGHWLQTGLELPEIKPSNTISTEDIKTLHHTCKTLGGTWQALQQRKISPAEAFKATMGQFIGRLTQEHQQYALLATDMLTTIQGPFREGLKDLLTETLPDPNAKLVIVPVRESRNMAFDTVFLPFAHGNHWPLTPGTVLDMDTEHERRLFYMALTRSSGGILCSAYSTLSPFIQEVQSSLTPKKKSKAA